MLSNFFKPLNLLCIGCYIAFMVFALDSTAVDALVFFTEDQNNEPLFFSGEVETSTVSARKTKNSSPIVAIQYKKNKVASNLVQLEEPEITKLESEEKSSLKVENKTEQPQKKKPAAKTAKQIALKTVSASTAAVPATQEAAKQKQLKNAAAAMAEKKAEEKIARLPSALDYIKAVKNKKWEYASLLDRYIVRYDKETYIVLTIRPKLQKRLENVFKKYSTRIGACVFQDPGSGAIYALASSHKNKILDIEKEEFKSKHWALKATFPVASIFKIITASAGLDTGKITPNTRIRAWKKSYLKVWRAFARSHNGVFGRIARKAGKKIMNQYIDAFGFNKPFFFDLPVGKSLAKLPDNKWKMGQAAAGLNRDFVVSPMHVASIVSTVLNRGKMMKPYLVDYVVRSNKVIFRRQPFQIAEPIKAETAQNIYKMMYTTTAVGTGKKGFGGYRRCPDLHKMNGGKTGTLTGASPHYLFTWFGGFTKVMGRDLCFVTLVGQRNHRGTKAASIAGQIAYELYMERKKAKEERLASR
jgi:cell division protein FtsI/penicillin-binding protein 2